jgi:LEA14-like dessication related protein
MAQLAQRRSLYRQEPAGRLVNHGVIWSTHMFSTAHATRLLALSLLLSALSGCSLLRTSDYQEPEVRLLKVQMVKARLLQQDLRLYFRIANPNDRSVLVRGLRYRVMLNDVALAEGEWSEWFVVQGDSHGNFMVPVRTNLWRHAKYIAALLKKPEQAIHYRLEGKLKTGFLFRHNVLIGRDGEIIPKDLIAE